MQSRTEAVRNRADRDQAVFERQIAGSGGARRRTATFPTWQPRLEWLTIAEQFLAKPEAAGGPRRSREPTASAERGSVIRRAPCRPASMLLEILRPQGSNHQIVAQNCENGRLRVIAV